MIRLPLVATVLASLFLARAALAEDATARGEYVARAGDCVACHSTPGGKAFAGGLKMATPVGTIAATNITPDPETGIGAYTLDDFDRALRRGIARDGHHLYPAMPYPSYAVMADDDVRALYDYFMHAVPPVRQANLPSDIPGHLSPRWPLAVWNWVFTPATGYTGSPSHDARWNRGAYLVEGLGHCGACHTPRGWAWQEKSFGAGDAAFLSGANLDDWYAGNLRRNAATGLGAWSEADIVAFLKTGRNSHASAYGSMSEVIANSTSYLTDDDLAAIAAYLVSLPATDAEAPWRYDASTAAALKSGHADAPGARLYAGSCQACHRETGGAAPPYLPPLAGNPTVLDRDPASLINVVLNGTAPLVAKGRPDAYRMPQFRAQLSNREVADIVTFMRASWGNHAPAVTAEAVAAIRNRTEPSSDRVVPLRMR